MFSGQLLDAAAWETSARGGGSGGGGSGGGGIVGSRSPTPLQLLQQHMQQIAPVNIFKDDIHSFDWPSSTPQRQKHASNSSSTSGCSVSASGISGTYNGGNGGSNVGLAGGVMGSTTTTLFGPKKQVLLILSGF